jgi:hypothetical protein
MLKKLSSLALAALLVHAALATNAQAKPAAERDAQLAGRVKASIVKLGTGEAARVRVKLRDGSKVEGYVREAGADAFTVADTKTGTETVVAYQQVKQIKGNNLSTGAKIAIGVGIAVVVLILVIRAAGPFGPSF